MLFYYLFVILIYLLFDCPREALGRVSGSCQAGSRLWRAKSCGFKLPQDKARMRRGLHFYGSANRRALWRESVKFQLANRTLIMKVKKLDYTKTKTWRAWEGSVLSSFPACQSETKTLLALLLTATSPTNMEELSVGPVIPDACRPSIAMRRGLKEVWRVMQTNGERWVIMAASFEGLGLGLGFTEFFWEKLAQGRPVIRYEQGVTLLGILGEEWNQPAGSVRAICHDMEIFYPDEGDSVVWSPTHRCEINLATDTDFLRHVQVSFYCPNRNEIFAIFYFDKRLFTEGNVIPFKKGMSKYSVLRKPSGYALSNNPAICYRIQATDQELRNVVELHDGDHIPNRHRSLFFKPKEGLAGFVQAKLREMGVTLLGEIVRY